MVSKATSELTLATPFTGTEEFPLTQGGNSRKGTINLVRDYVASLLVGLFDLKGSTDASTNPNYPAASKGDTYVVSVAGRIGGASGPDVEIGDVYFANVDTLAGNHATVGSSWSIIERNIPGDPLLITSVADVLDIFAGTETNTYIPPATLIGAVEPVTIAYAATIAIDFDDGINFEIDQTGDLLLDTPVNTKPGSSGIIEVSQDATGGRAITFGGGWVHLNGTPVDLQTDANAINLFGYYINSFGIPYLTHMNPTA